VLGDLTRELVIERVIRVDHAGEYGAKRICEGQLAMLGRSQVASILEKVTEQELHHLAIFEELIAERNIRPSLLNPIWHIVGFALGASTALLGESTAMACIVAVEEVIDEHYQRQINILGSGEPELLAIIEACHKDEIEHRDLGLAHRAAEAPGYPVIKLVIKTAARAAIWLSERL
jgi:ubiquinone biosynthesis monooxygenase Coq7